MASITAIVPRCGWRVRAGPEGDRSAKVDFNATEFFDLLLELRDQRRAIAREKPFAGLGGVFISTRPAAVQEEARSEMIPQSERGRVSEERERERERRERASITNKRVSVARHQRGGSTRPAEPPTGGCCDDDVRRAAAALHLPERRGPPDLAVGRLLVDDPRDAVGLERHLEHAVRELDVDVVARRLELLQLPPPQPHPPPRRGRGRGETRLRFAAHASVCAREERRSAAWARRRARRRQWKGGGEK